MRQLIKNRKDQDTPPPKKKNPYVGSPNEPQCIADIPEEGGERKRREMLTVRAVLAAE